MKEDLCLTNFDISMKHSFQVNSGEEGATRIIIEETYLGPEVEKNEVLLLIRNPDGHLPLTKGF